MLSVLSSVKFICKAAAFMLLPLLASSCQWMTEDDDCETDISTARQYINITISVSADNKPITRAPLGGEYGDGTEMGNDRENLVNNITLIFYEDVSGGINTTSGDAAVACVKTYIVTPVSFFSESALIGVTLFAVPWTVKLPPSPG